MPAPDPEPSRDDLLAFAGRLFDLARSGTTATLAGYLDAGISPGLTNAGGDSLLMLAAYHEHADTVRLLLEHAAPVDTVNDRGQTPLVAAVFRRSEPIVRALIAAGADPDAGGPSARATAEFYGLTEMAALLAGRSERAG